MYTTSFTWKAKQKKNYFCIKTSKIIHLIPTLNTIFVNQLQRLYCSLCRRPQSKLMKMLCFSWNANKSQALIMFFFNLKTKKNRICLRKFNEIMNHLLFSSHPVCTTHKNTLFFFDFSYHWHFLTPFTLHCIRKLNFYRKKSLIKHKIDCLEHYQFNESKKKN